MAEQLTKPERTVIEAVRKVCLSGHGQVTVNIHRGQVKDVVKNETEKIHVDAG